MEPTTIAERRIDSRVRLMRIAGVLCALFAAAGICHGMHQANPEGGWFVPAFAGIVAASAFAIFWHVVIGAVVGMVRRTMLFAIFGVAAIVTVIALGASAQAIATAIAGEASLSAELSAVVDGYSAKLSKAYAEATKWQSLVGAAVTKANGFGALAKGEEAGGHGTGKGCGPKCTEYQEFEANFEGVQAALGKTLDEAKADRDVGEASLADLRSAAAHADQNGFITAAGGVTDAIEKLNAVDPLPIIAQAGGSVANAKGIDMTKETKEFVNMANRQLASRQPVVAPTFAPMSVGEATRRQMFGAALHAWILASVIDMLPLFFLILAFALSREVWLNEDRARKRDVGGQGQGGPRNGRQPFAAEGPALPGGRRNEGDPHSGGAHCAAHGGDGASHRSRPRHHARGRPHHGRLRRVLPWNRPATPYEPGS